MGLDMYLFANKHNHQFSRTEVETQIIEDALIRLDNDFYNIVMQDQQELPSVSIVIEIGYWRKCNAIHKWFVDNVQNGIDECQESYVGFDALHKLQESLNEVIADPELGPKVLPTTDGFFFGDTSYDEFYIDDLKYTLEIVKRAIRLISEHDCIITYQSSW